MKPEAINLSDSKIFIKAYKGQIRFITIMAISLCLLIFVTSYSRSLTSAKQRQGQTKEAQTFPVNQAGSGDTLSEIKISASDGMAGYRFGGRVAISGDTAVVGAPGNGSGFLGAAYVFIRNANGTWSQQAKLTSSDSGVAGFGAGVAIDGDTIVVGAPSANIGANTDQGAAYIFVRNGTSWTQQTRLLASDGAALDQFGTSVAISGNTVVVGVLGPGEGFPGINGAAYVFVRNGTSWTQQQKLTASDGATRDYFGIVAISGNTIIVGAYFDDIGTNTNQGSAYVFTRNGTTWTQQQKLTANDAGPANLGFGYSVAIEGNTAVIGKLTGIPLMSTIVGAAYVFVQSGNTWTQQQKLLGTPGATNDAFGESVAVSGNRIIVGVRGDNIGSNSDQGSAYPFVRSGDTWTQQPKLTASDGAAGDTFGQSVAISGNTIIIGSPQDDNKGSAYIFREVSNTAINLFDFDGDSKTDISVFRPSSGAWYIVQSSNSSFRSELFGTAGDKIMPGDYDGDRKTDIAVWRPSTGYWYIINSSNGVFRSIPFGQAGDIPAAGDFDGDGKADIAVYRPSNNNFYITYSSDNSFHYQQWGANGDLPLPGDYDGDNKTDFAIFRPSTSSFYVLRSSNSTVLGQQFGQSGDKPLTADFDGDAKTDITVYRPSTGGWYYLQSSDNGFRGVSWGASGDTAAAGDYDGDGKWDVAVFRPSSGTFYILQSMNNSLRAEQFGANGDIPVPSAYLP